MVFARRPHDFERCASAAVCTEFNISSSKVCAWKCAIRLYSGNLEAHGETINENRKDRKYVFVPRPCLSGWLSGVWVDNETYCISVYKGNSGMNHQQLGDKNHQRMAVNRLLLRFAGVPSCILCRFNCSSTWLDGCVAEDWRKYQVVGRGANHILVKGGFSVLGGLSGCGAFRKRWWIISIHSTNQWNVATVMISSWTSKLPVVWSKTERKKAHLFFVCFSLH